MATPRSTAPATPVLAVSCRMLRSPSHESVTTDLSLFSVSSLQSEALGKHRVFALKEQRGPSPNPDAKLHLTRPANIPEVTWFEEGNDLIRSCAALSSALGMQKSFSTSDITQLPLPESQTNQLRATVSELALNSLQRCGYMLENPRLDHTSRSCSTWVAVGELASTSQLPSPHGGSVNPPALTNTSTPTPPPAAFTAADLIRSVNKKVRQNYIRRRLLTTYRALERLSQSEFNLDRLEAAAVAAASINSGSITGPIIGKIGIQIGNNGPGPTELVVPTNILQKQQQAGKNNSTTTVTTVATTTINTTTTTTTIVTTTEPFTNKSPGKAMSNDLKNNKEVIDAAKQASQTKAILCEQLKKKISMNVNQNLTIHDIERERGKPLSKYERNMMIFNWLHSLDETSTVEDMP